MTIVEQTGLVASVVMPLWNIPLIVRIVQRKSSVDISMAWVMGVWVCAILMAPSGFMSKDVVWRTFNIVNLILFSGVVITVLRYRKGPNAKS
jgi:hypothetical protein